MSAFDGARTLFRGRSAALPAVTSGPAGPAGAPLYDAGLIWTPPLPPGAATSASRAPGRRVSSVMSGVSSEGVSFSERTWNRSSFLRSAGLPPRKSETLGPPARATASKAALFGARTVPEKLGPSSPARPALSTSCFRSEYSLFLERAVVGVWGVGGGGGG